MAVPTRPVSGSVVEFAWGQVAHDTAVAMDIQAGYVDVAVTAAASRTLLVTFPRPFASTPTVVVSGDSATAGLVAKTSQTTPPTPTAFTAVAQHVAGTSGTWTLRLAWIAYGPRG